MMTINRRDFIGGVIAAASASRLRSGMPIGGLDPVAGRDWMRRGLIDAGGSHEPYLFVVRRGGQRLDARQTGNYQQSEEMIRELQRAGVEMFHTHLYKGFGMLNAKEWKRRRKPSRLLTG
jgi:hypothetical protein